MKGLDDMISFISEGLKAVKELNALVDSVNQKTEETKKSLRVNGVVIDRCFTKEKYFPSE